MKDAAIFVCTLESQRFRTTVGMSSFMLSTVCQIFRVTVSEFVESVVVSHIHLPGVLTHVAVQDFLFTVYFQTAAFHTSQLQIRPRLVRQRSKQTARAGPRHPLNPPPKSPSNHFVSRTPSMSHTLHMG